MAKFCIDRENKTASCPRKRQSSRWAETRTARGRSMIHIEFPLSECIVCPSRSSCTRAKNVPRSLSLQPREEHEAI